ncbi:MAG: calcium/sodium antiporter [Lachnospiraceae bacterium]|nr:calcium/sodium antiporter [Lachnospiraceae bacterium]
MIALQFLVLCIGFFLLIKGADWFVDGCAGIANKFDIPQIVIGLTIVAMGTSLPEAAVSITAAFKGNAGISVGNVIGSNLLNILIILGATALITPLKLKANTLKYEIPFMLFISVIMLVMGHLGNSLSRTEGIILWLFFIGYLTYLYFLSKNEKDSERTVTDKPIWKLIFSVIIGVGVIVIGSNLSVDAAVVIAKGLGISDRIIGLTIIALGTSLPELVTALIASKKGNDDLAIGNIIGSNIFNILFVIGTSSIIIPIKFNDAFLIDGGIAIFAGISLFLLSMRKKELRRFGGLLLLGEYAVYFIYLLMK